MTNSARLEGAEITVSGDDYLVRIRLDDGTSFEMVAGFDQLDDLAEAIDRQLEADEED